MFVAPAGVVLVAAALAAVPRPSSVALTFEGAGLSTQLEDFLRVRVREAFDIETISRPAQPSAGGDFHVHVAALPDEVYSVHVREAGATIATRDIVHPEDPNTEVWFLVKTTLRRALFAASPSVESRVESADSARAPGGP